MEIMNVMAYLVKKSPAVTWREEEFYFSIFPFYVCFLSHLFPFILSLISEKEKENHYLETRWEQYFVLIFS